LWGSDGGLYGYYAKEILLGNALPFDSEHIPGYLLAYITKIFPISLDRAIFYAPVFLSSLSVIPIIMIGYAYQILRFSMFVALIGSVTYGYYLRSFLGYYDTDALNIFFSLLSVAFMILSVEKKNLWYLFAAFVSLSLFYMWYHSSKLIILAIIINFICYIIIWKFSTIFQRKKFFFLSIFVLFLGSLFFHTEIVDFFTRAYDYIFKAQHIYLTQENNHKLVFANTLATVGEAKPLAIEKLGRYLSINNFYLFVSFISLLLFYFRFRSFLLTLSLLFIALLSLKSGIRFSEYGVYIIAFGSVYALQILKNIFVRFGLKKSIAEILFILAFMILFSLYLQKIVTKNKYLHPVLSKESVIKLRLLDRRLTSNDYILTWWDYGWPLWYYTKANTLIDNGKHFEDNYIISKLFFSDQKYTAKAAKYLLQNCEGKRCFLSRKIFRTKSPKEIDEIIQASHIENIDKKIYFLFHTRMVKIMRIISNFSKIDPETGLKNKKQIVNIVKIRNIQNGVIHSLNDKVALDLLQKQLRLNNKILKLKDIYIVNKHKIIKIKTSNKNSKLHAIFYHKRYIIVCTQKVFDSFIIQAMILNHYDKNLFKLVAKSDELKILELK